MKDTWEEEVTRILETHSELFTHLAQQEEIDKQPFSQRERDAFYHLLTNQAEIKKEIDSTHNSGAHHYPPRFYDVYADNFQANAIKIILSHVTSFNLSPEETHTLSNPQYLNSILGDNFIKPPRN